MLAIQSPILEDAVETVYELTADESIREQCKAREKHIREMNTILGEREIAVQERDKAVQERDEAVQERNEAVQERDEVIRQTNLQLTQQIQQNELLQQEIERLKGRESLNN